MKTLIILSSASGVGKTSTIIPAIVGQLGATEVSTVQLLSSPDSTHDLCVTDCLNMEEYKILREHCGDYKIITVGLGCLNPVKTSPPERKMLPVRFFNVWLEYKLEDLDDTLEKILDRIRLYL